MSELNQNEQILIINDQSVSITDDEQMQKLEDELQAKVLIRTIDDENDSDYEDVDDDDVEQISKQVTKYDDNQYVPDVQSKEKSIEKTVVLLDDDNDSQSPAYIPRKGKFYEHDDRTIDDNHRTKPHHSKNLSRFYCNSDGKWQHDLYFQDQNQTKSRRSHSQNYNREQFHLNDYVSRPSKTFRQMPVHKDTRNRMTNFEFKDNNRNIIFSNQTKQQIDERTFHRRKNFLNSQFQSTKYSIRNRMNSTENLDRNDLKINRSSHLQLNANQQNSMLNHQSNIERSKRYSNMRNNLTNSTQQQRSIAQISNSNANEQSHSKRDTKTTNEWPQAPPPPTTSFLSQQLITPQMFYQQQTSRYVPLNYSQTSISEQFQASK